MVQLMHRLTAAPHPILSSGEKNEANELISTSEDLQNVGSGEYELTVEDTNGCEVSISFDVDSIITATHFAFSENDVEVFPNPTTGLLYVQFQLPVQGLIEVTARDVLGRKVVYQHFEEQKTDGLK